MEAMDEASAKDISVQGFFAYDLSERWRGGVSLKFLYSTLADYTSIGLGVDAGLSYYDSDKKFSLEITHASESVGEKLHLVPGARRLDPLPTRARSARYFPA